MNKTRMRYLLSRGTEIGIMLLLVSVFFALLTTLLFRMFPAGITLTQILEQRSRNSGPRGCDTSRRVTLGLKKKEAQAAATLVRLGNEVRSKGASSIAWGPASEGMKLSDHDAVQTFTRSSAQINFDSSNYMTMGSNSLVVIKRIEKEPASHQGRSTIVVIDGLLNGHAASGPKRLTLKIATPSAQVKIGDVSAQGKTVRVSESCGLPVKQGDAPKEPAPFPAAPTQTTPAEGSVIGYRELPQRIPFTWSGGKGSSRYHLQLARDRGYLELLLDTMLDQPESVHGNLKKGVYFWRVSRIEGGVEGVMSSGARFEVAQKLNQPQLLVSFPSGPVRDEEFVLAGSTTPGNRVLVGGKATPTDASGAFSCRMPLKRGLNLITVEAVDQWGNVTYSSCYVKARF